MTRRLLALPIRSLAAGALTVLAGLGPAVAAPAASVTPKNGTFSGRAVCRTTAQFACSHGDPFSASQPFSLGVRQRRVTDLVLRFPLGQSDNDQCGRKSGEP